MDLIISQYARLSVTLDMKFLVNIVGLNVVQIGNGGQNYQFVKVKDFFVIKLNTYIIKLSC